MTILLPFPVKSQAEDALAYWTPADFVPKESKPFENASDAALAQMYEYYDRT